MRVMPPGRELDGWKGAGQAAISQVACFREMWFHGTL
jgi:hypothetical protein